MPHKKKSNIFRRLCCFRCNWFSRTQDHNEDKITSIYLMSKDFELIKTNEADIRVSRELRHQLDIAGQEKYVMVFYCPKVDAEIIRYIIKYGEFHKDDERRKERTRRREIRAGVQAPGPSDFRKNKNKPEPGYWDTKFMENVKPKLMLPLFYASINLGIENLTELIYVYTAFWLRNKNDYQIRSLTKIKSDITTQEEADIHAQSAFLANGD